MVPACELLSPGYIIYFKDWILLLSQCHSQFQSQGCISILIAELVWFGSCVILCMSQKGHAKIEVLDVSEFECAAKKPSTSCLLCI